MCIIYLLYLPICEMNFIPVQFQGSLREDDDFAQTGWEEIVYY